jgi:FlaA1/EpsC-like NDP-sugar epimerase
VYHVAAYKHVPLVEHNPAEGVRNNVWGPRVCAEAAMRSSVRNFVLVSTDKAVRPTNIMGATKRLAEMVLQALADVNAAVAAQGGRAPTARTTFSMVRFGNVLDSSGSVVPLFREQIKNGGPITLTHPEVTRFFMTIPEAAQLVIQAGAMAKGGDVFVLDMGQSVKGAVQLVDHADATDEFAEELLGWLRDQLAHYKCPRSISFEEQLPRTDTGKLYKQSLIGKYSAAV